MNFKVNFKMKSLRLALSLLALFAATFASAQTPAQKSFDELKSLSGSWEGKNSEGKSLRVSFRDTAGGSALMSEIQAQDHDDMISMIHLDGSNRLVMTHYCSAGNQPRMATIGSPDGKTITFDFFDATNLGTPVQDTCSGSCSQSSTRTITPKTGLLTLDRARS